MNNYSELKIVKSGGAQFLRGGAYKPRTSPYYFRTKKIKATEYLGQAREATGLKVVTEVTEVEAVEAVICSADIVQVKRYAICRNFPFIKEE